MENDGDVLQGITLCHTCNSARVGRQGQPLSHSALAELCVTLFPCQTSASFRLSSKGAEP